MEKWGKRGRVFQTEEESVQRPCGGDAFGVLGVSKEADEVGTK